MDRIINQEMHPQGTNNSSGANHLSVHSNISMSVELGDLGISIEQSFEQGVAIIA